jgi:hypothetical protein
MHCITTMTCAQHSWLGTAFYSVTHSTTGTPKLQYWHQPLHTRRVKIPYSQEINVNKITV